MVHSIKSRKSFSYHSTGRMFRCHSTRDEKFESNGYDDNEETTTESFRVTVAYESYWETTLLRARAGRKPIFETSRISLSSLLSLELGGLPRTNLNYQLNKTPSYLARRFRQNPLKKKKRKKILFTKIFLSFLSLAIGWLTEALAFTGATFYRVSLFIVELQHG